VPQNYSTVEPTLFPLLGRTSVKGKSHPKPSIRKRSKVIAIQMRLEIGSNSK